MLTITFKENDLASCLVNESVILHADLLSIYEEISEEVHYSSMCESTNFIMSGIESIRNGFKDLFARLRRFFKTIIDKFIALFTKKTRITDIKKERLRSILKDNIDITPFKISTYDYFFIDNLGQLVNIAHSESSMITHRINEILKNGENTEFYKDINALKANMNTEESFNRIRRDIIITFNPNKSGAPIPKNQYVPELEMVLRGGTITKSEMEITRSVLEKVIEEDDKQAKIRKSLETYKNDMINMFNILESDFNKAVRVISDETWKVDAKVNSPMKSMNDIKVFNVYEFEYSKKILESLNGLFNTSVTYFKNLSDTISTAFTEYSKAVSESMDTNSEIFTIALDNIERMG